MRSRTLSSSAVLAAAALVATSSCGPPPYRPSNDRPKPAPLVAAPARWETYATSALGPRIDGRRYVVLNGKLAWWEPSGEFVFGPASLPNDLGELYAVPTEKGTALLAKSARPMHSSRFGRGPTKLYRIAEDRRSATTLVHTKDSVRVLGSAYGALVVTGTSIETWLLDVDTGASKPWPRIARASWIAFHDQRNGAALFQGGGLQVTADGGATFRPAALPPPLETERIAGYEWTTEGIVVLAKESSVANGASATGFLVDPRTGVVTPLVEEEKPLERWLRGRPTGWEPATWQTLELAQRHGVLARDGGAFMTAKDTTRGPSEGGTVFAHMDLATGFVDFMADAPDRRCFLLGHDAETMWLGCQDDRRQDQPYWVERVERTPEALRRALAAFPDDTRVFPVHPRNVDWDRGLGVNLAPGMTLFFGSCTTAERRGFDCLVDPDGDTRDIHPSAAAQPVIATGSRVVRASGEKSKLLVERLGADGRWEPLAEASVAQAKNVLVTGAYEPDYGKVVAFVSDGDVADKAWRVELDTTSGQSTVHELDGAPVFQMRGQRGVDVSGAYARRTADGGRTWSDFELFGEAEEFVDVTEVGVRFPDSWIIGWDDQKTMPKPPAPPAASEATDHPFASSPPTPSPPGVLVCKEAGPPVPSPSDGAEPPAALSTDVSNDGTGKWELRWTDAAGKKRRWSGVGPSLGATLVEFDSAGSTTGFVFDVGTRELVVGRAIEDRVELSPPMHAGASRLTVRVGPDGSIAFGGVVTSVWPAGKPVESILPVARVGDEIAIESVSPGFLTFSTSQTGYRAMYPSDRYVSVPNVPATAEPAPLPALGWFTSSAFPLAWSTPCAASPKGRVRVAREARVLEKYALDGGSGPPAFAQLPVRTVVFELGVDVGKPLDPTTTCVAGVSFSSTSGPNAGYSFVTKKGALYTMDVQPITCVVLAEADYPSKL